MHSESTAAMTDQTYRYFRKPSSGYRWEVAPNGIITWFWDGISGPCVHGIEELLNHPEIVETTATGTAIAEDAPKIVKWFKDTQANRWRVYNNDTAEIKWRTATEWYPTAFAGLPWEGWVETDEEGNALSSEPGAGGAGDENTYEPAETLTNGESASESVTPTPAPGLTPTPRTDAFRQRANLHYVLEMSAWVCDECPTYLMDALERELAEATERAERNDKVACETMVELAEARAEARMAVAKSVNRSMEANTLRWEKEQAEQAAAGMRKALEGKIEDWKERATINETKAEELESEGDRNYLGTRCWSQAYAKCADELQALAGASGDGKEGVDTHAEIAAGLPFVVPPFALPDRLKNTEYAWFSWHPCYPYWSESCFTGTSTEDAQKWKTAGTSAKMRIYWNKLVRKDGDRSEVVEDWLGDEALSNWEMHRKWFDSGEREYTAIPQPPAGRAGA